MLGRFSVSPNPGGLLRSLPRYRRDHPMPGEEGKLTLVGWTPGRSVAAGKSYGVWFITAVLVAIVLWGVGVPPGVAGVAGTLLPAFVFLLKRRLRPDESDELHLLALTDKRAIVLTSTWGGEPVAVEHPPDWVTWAEVESFRSIWVGRRQVPKMVLGDADGEVLTLELPNTDPKELEAILTDAGLWARPEWLPKPAADDPGDVNES
jgi:hypothetical protein